MFPSATLPLLTCALAVVLAVNVGAEQGSDGAVQHRRANEQDIKAAFLYNFTRFVSWPAGIPPGTEPFRLCVVADAPTIQAVQRTMAGESVNGRAAETHVPAEPGEVKQCQVLFVSHEAEARSRGLLAAARDLPVLVVGDGEGFPSRGGVIGFVLENGKLRFDIHIRNAERAGLTVSSRLLSVARRTDAGR